MVYFHIFSLKFEIPDLLFTESAKEMARYIGAALNEQAHKTTSAVSTFQQNFNPTRYEQQLDKLSSQFYKMQASMAGALG